MDSPVGIPMNRRDGREKVTGRARFSAEWPRNGMCYAVAVASSAPRGKVFIDRAAAERAPGVLKVITFDNAPRLGKPKVLDPNKPDPQATAATRSYPLQSNDISYCGQYIACLVGRTLEEAQHAAGLLAIRYDPGTFNTDPLKAMDSAKTPERIMGRPGEVTVGSPEEALARSMARVDNWYSTPRQHHNPIETHTTTAVWLDGGKQLSIHDATQNIFAVRGLLAESFGLSPQAVQVQCPYTGGAFGCKGSVWPHVALTAMAAKVAARPVQLMLTREQMFGDIGHRSPTRQRVALGADADGRLEAVIHEGFSFTSRKDDFIEAFTIATPHLVLTPNRRTSQRLGRLDTSKPTFMRAPGETPGTFAFECALDELADVLKMDPIQLRRRNEPDKDPESGQAWSDRRLMECYDAAAERIGWNTGRASRAGSRREGKWLIGMGCASSTYPCNQFACSAKVRLNADGGVLITAGTHELGTGTVTAQSQLAAEHLGIDVRRVRMELGDSRFPEAPVSGGSATSVSVGSAVIAAIGALKDALIGLDSTHEQSALRGMREEDVEFADGTLRKKGDNTRGERLEAILERHMRDHVEAEASVLPSGNKGGQDRGGKDEKGNLTGFAKHSFGAQFCEVAVDTDLGIIRLRRHVGCFACGRILNAKTARSQVIGGMIMGIGMALLEEARVDHRLGRVINANLADYLVACNADITNLDGFFLDHPDFNANVTGAKGIGEIGITGAAAAVANAVYNATGRRIRDLPITLDKLL